jgi:hypothetical protein
MSSKSISIIRTLRTEVNDKKYALAPGNELSIAPGLLTHRQAFYADWDNLEPDEYLKGDARFRLRRMTFFYFLPATGEVLAFPSTPYFQPLDMNAYAGGIQRHFAPIGEETQANPFLHELIRFSFRHLPVDSDAIHSPWKLDVHQIRIVASPQEAGKPTPEGVHHDENDFISMHLIRRENATGGVSTIYDKDLNPLMSCTLSQPLDTMLVWDKHVMHGVTPIRSADADRPAIREMLLVGYDLNPDLQRPQPEQ